MSDNCATAMDKNHFAAVYRTKASTTTVVLYQTCRPRTDDNSSIPFLGWEASNSVPPSTDEGGTRLRTKITLCRRLQTSEHSVDVFGREATVPPPMDEGAHVNGRK